MFKIQRKDLYEHTNHCSKALKQSEECSLCGKNYQLNFGVTHMQECEGSVICENCHLKYDQNNKGKHECLEYMKAFVAEKNN
mmetsp:Transcript_14085/g.13692  ORF Transcript_14085/g.13692 Transcript_14085/m.13692 type:complete len:82 (+) Transcript_14085:417-662(+)